MKFSFAALLATVSLFAIAPAIQAQEQMNEQQMEAVVKKVIENNPELIMKTLQNYEIKQRADSMSKAMQNIKKEQGNLKGDAFSPAIGNPKGDVTVVEFFDYHCGYCKHFFPAISKLVEEDKNVRVVFKEFPILSEDSATAAKASLAVNSIDKSKYFAFHSALMQASGNFSMGMLEDKARAVGIDKSTFETAFSSPMIDNELDKNRQLAQELNISGTPMIIVGDQMIPGAVSLEMLKEKIADARKAKKS